MLSALRADAHGGLDASAFVLDPQTPGTVVDDSFTFRWADASDIGTATASTTHSFFFTSRIPPPWAVFAEPVGLEGTPIAERIPEREPANTFTWRTATVAAGAYWLWSRAEDPDLEIPSQTVVFSPFPVVVAHAGDPVHPFVSLQTPDGPSAFAEDDQFEVEYAVFDPDGSADVLLERALDGEETFEAVAILDPALRSLTMDTSTWTEGDWVLRARLEDGRGLTFSAFARFPLAVARARPRDAGSPDAPAAADLGLTDLGSETPATPPSGDCRCVNSRASGSAWGLGFTLVLVLLLTQSSPERRRGRYVPPDV
ncbi:MAG: hypothetical protein AAFZ18_30335 [Myxococcota bacterium]